MCNEYALQIDFVTNQTAKARGVENRPTAKTRGTPKSLRLENYAKP
jgi:hypothetical protein